MKNREDVIALRWPRACLSCGVDVPANAYPRNAIVGLFHVDKKQSRGDRRETQVLLKLPGFFYICHSCSDEITSALEMPPKGLEKLVENLDGSPWVEFIELEKSGHVKIPDGSFKEKLQCENPDAWLKPKDCPMSILREGIARERSI